MNTLTFLLPLKDRSSYTRIWLDNNIRPEYDYFIADGSIGSENEEIFRTLKLPNLTYVRCPEDTSIACYVDKMFQSVRRIKTKYVMTCDNDDFINYKGVEACLSALAEDRGAACAGGPIYGILQKESASLIARYSLPIKAIDAAQLNGLSGFDALVQLFKSYKHMWYSVFRTDTYCAIWSDIAQLQLSNVFLVELLQAELAFCHGKYIHVNNNHYIRLLNPVTSCAKELTANNISHAHKIFFDDEYRSQVLKLTEHVASLVEVDTALLLKEFKNYFISCVSKKPLSRYSKVMAQLNRIHETGLRKLGIYFPIDYCIWYLNAIK